MTNKEFDFTNDVYWAYPLMHLLSTRLNLVAIRGAFVTNALTAGLPNAPVILTNELAVEWFGASKENFPHIAKELCDCVYELYGNHLYVDVNDPDLLDGHEDFSYMRWCIRRTSDKSIAFYVGVRLGKYMPYRPVHLQDYEFHGRSFRSYVPARLVANAIADISKGRRLKFSLLELYGLSLHPGWRYRDITDNIEKLPGSRTGLGSWRDFEELATVSPNSTVNGYNRWRGVTGKPVFNLAYNRALAFLAPFRSPNTKMQDGIWHPEKGKTNPFIRNASPLNHGFWVDAKGRRIFSKEVTIRE